jgi:serine/threonine-protein kinase RsbW
MAMVEVAFTPLPAHVRTARLVTVAVARRSGVPEALLDEVRLAVGEACSRAVEAHRQHCPAEPVKLELTDSDGRFEVVVTDGVPGHEDGVPQAPGAPGTGTGTGPVGGSVPRPAGHDGAGPDDSIGLAVIAELADDVRISRSPAGISVCMSWPSANVRR